MTDETREKLREEKKVAALRWAAQTAYNHSRSSSNIHHRGECTRHWEVFRALLEAEEESGATLPRPTKAYVRAVLRRVAREGEFEEADVEVLAGFPPTIKAAAPEPEPEEGEPERVSYRDLNDIMERIEALEERVETHVHSLHSYPPLPPKRTPEPEPGGEAVIEDAMGGVVCKSHGKGVLVTHLDGEPCSDYLVASYMSRPTTPVDRDSLGWRKCEECGGEWSEASPGVDHMSDALESLHTTEEEDDA